MCAPCSAAFRMSPSFSITSMVASPASQATGLPPKVEVCEPLSHDMTRFRAITAPNGKPPPTDLAIQMTSGATPACSIEKNLPVGPMHACTSSYTSYMPLSVISRRSPIRTRPDGPAHHHPHHLDYT